MARGRRPLGPARTGRALVLTAMLAAAPLAGPCKPTSFAPRVAGLAAQVPPTGPAVQTRDGRALYLAACAGCHGGDGTGTEQALLAFEEEPPDFSDCSFASREPAADWVIVAHQGGPVRAFSEMMPAFGEALEMEQLESVVDYIQTLCSDRSWPRGELNLPRALVTEKAFPEDEWVLENEASVEGPASLLHTLVYEKRFGSRTQLELALPFGYRKVDAAGGGERSWAAGVGDVAVGLKHALLHGVSDGGGHILSVVGEVKLPTGDEPDGFGSGSTALEGFLSFGQILPSDAFLQLQAGAERSTAGGGAETELFWNGVLGRSFAQGTWGRTWSPMLEVLGRREGDEGTSWELIPQLHVSLSTRQHIMLTVGPRIPLHDEGATTLMLSFLWDWFDGPLTEGW